MTGVNRSGSGLGSSAVIPLASKIASQQKLRTCAIGDSISFYCGVNSFTQGAPVYPVSRYTNRSWLTRANAMIDNAMLFLNIAGVSGNTLTQMAARYETDVIAFNPNFVIIEGCSNDLDQGYSANQIFAQLMVMYKRNLSIGASTLYVGTAAMARFGGAPVSPVDGIQYRESQEFGRLYKLCTHAAAILPGFMFHRMSLDMQDYGATKTVSEMAQGVAKPGTQADSTHPGPYGAFGLMGESLGDFLRSSIGRLSPNWVTIGNDSTDGPNGDPAIWNKNPLLAATTSATATGPNTGTIPDNTSVATVTGPINAVCSVISRTDGGPGRKLRMAVSGATNVGGIAAPDYIQFQRIQSVPTYTNYTTYADGLHTVVARARVQIPDLPTAGQVTGIQGDLQLRNASNQIIARSQFGYKHSTVADEDLTGLVGAIDFGLQETPPILIPATCTQMIWNINILTSTGAILTVDISDFNVEIDDYSSVITPYLT